MISLPLQTAIEEVYSGLHAPKPRVIHGCPCCTHPQELCRLLAKPLRALSADDLSNYAASLFWTMGDTEDFKYFLPRLREIAVSQEWWPSPPVLLHKLTLAKWHSWPKRERTLVKNLIDAWFTEVLEADRLDGSEIDELVCGIGRAGLPLAEYLVRLSKRPKVLQAFFDVHAHAYFKRKRLGSSFWTDSREAEAVVIDFFRSPEARQQLSLPD